ncbi:MAG: hypothetical protein K8R64_07865 [Methanosarcinaceae archaeon]|nr:hypothetical protein [Methanosarcinaceae archaeon]
MDNKKGRYVLIASIASSVLICAVFMLLAMLKNSRLTTSLYTQVDIMAGMIFVFILSFIVFVSLWSGKFEKKL